MSDESRDESRDESSDQPTDQPSDETRDDSADGAAADHETAASDRIVLRASALRWVWALIGSMAFVTLGGGMAFGAQTGIVARCIGVFIAALFGFCAVVAFRQVLDPGSLVVSRGAIDVIRRGRLTTFALQDCGRFTAWLDPNRGTTSVVFDYAPDGDTEINRTNRRLMGGSRSLSDSYGLSAVALAELLNGVRDRAAAGDADDTLPQA